LDNSDAEVIREAAAWLHEGRPVNLVTVARTWGSSPRPPGSLLAATPDGNISGSVSGGCIEDDLLERLRREDSGGPPRTICYGTTREEARRFGLPCGGRLELLLEFLTRPDALDPLLLHINENRSVTRTLDLESGNTALSQLQHMPEPFEYNGSLAKKMFNPPWHLLIIGAGHISRYLTEFARALDFRITLCDPRAEHARRWHIPGSTLVHTMPDDAVTELADSRTAVVTLAHDPRLDDLALLEALPSDAFYVGALGSRRASEQRQQRLSDMGLSPGILARLHAPIGLPINSRTPAEIAVAIIAHLTAVRNGPRVAATSLEDERATEAR